jgi:hypothetical protein
MDGDKKKEIKIGVIQKRYTARQKVTYRWKRSETNHTAQSLA